MNSLGNEELIIKPTDDGSKTIYLPALDEHYHSTKGALAESQHVYINTCWRKATALNESIRLFEVGFGTGLNAALAAETAMHEKKPTTCFSVELHPLDLEVLKTLGYEGTVPYYSEVIEAEWGNPVRINPFFSLTKISDNFLIMNLPERINAVFFDAFAPEKQPEMWEDNPLLRLYDNMVEGGVLSTYCAKGNIRRRLQSTGFKVERLPGPPGGKREILRAIKN